MQMIKVACILLVALLCCHTAFGSDYLYITFHGSSKAKSSAINTILAYTLDGRSIGTILGGDSKTVELRGMHSMLDGSLLVAQANVDVSAILSFSSCSNLNHTRVYSGSFTTSHLAHPYGLASAVLSNGQTVVYTSNQDTSSVTAYDASGNFLSTVQQFNTDAIRGLAYDPTSSLLYIANSDQNVVFAMDVNTNELVKSSSFQVDSPIGVYVDNLKRRIVIGSKSTNQVYVFDLTTSSLLYTLKDSNLSHPAGITMYGDLVYVLSQNTQQLLSFDLSQNGRSNGILIDNLPDAPEQLILSSC